MIIRDLAGALRGMLKREPATGVDPAGASGVALLLDQYCREASGAVRWRQTEPKEYEAGRSILASDPAAQVAAVHAALERMAARRFQLARADSWSRWQALHGLVNQLLARHLPFTAEDLRRLLDWLHRFAASQRIAPSALAYSHASMLPMRRILQQVERYEASEPLPDKLLSLLEPLRPTGSEEQWTGDQREFAARIDALLGQGPSPEQQASFGPGEPWAEAAAHDLQAMEAGPRAAWQALLLHARRMDGPRPNKKWLQQAETLLAAVGAAPFRERAARWLTGATEFTRAPLSDQNASLLKGLAWFCSLQEEESLSRAVGRLAESCYRKIPGIGPRSERVGNACAHVLGAMPGKEPVAQLARLRLRVRYRAGEEAVSKALEAAAERAGLPAEELEELMVPTYGLDEEGRLEETLGRFTAEIAVVGTRQFQWQWRTDDGRLQNSVPAEIRQSHPEELKALKQTVVELERMLPAQCQRVEALLRMERSWRLADWRERYLQHPLLSGISGCLIWHFQEGERAGLGIESEGTLVDASGRSLDWLTDETRVRLWHPIGFPPEVVQRWREWLEAHEVTQPFKQAHREVYLLTDAEVNTATYSNRFAAHLLKQHQFKALCDQRGWAYRLQGEFDSGAAPTAVLPQPGWGLRAEFWVDPVWDRGEGGTGSGVSQYVSTDQVRFCDTHDTPRLLTEVPALLFSEVMRDVDLFVGVASVGNDPAWADSGGATGYETYWHDYAFGDLSASAQTRRQILERLLPRLKIASRCSLDGKFLNVRGDLRTYKIHLGSGNILMEPNNVYLCIVPDRRPAGEAPAGSVFLPFEGDGTLSVILSKALLLAEDTKIKDPTITGQIRGR